MQNTENPLNIPRSTIEVMLDDIKNYRPLTETQLEKIESLTKEEKITIIKMYNVILTNVVELVDNS